MTFDTNKEKVIFIEGKNGTGKSTLLKILLGIYKPTTGTVFNIERIGYVPDSSEQYFVGMSPFIFFNFLRKQLVIDKFVFEKKLSILRENLYFPEKLMNTKITELSLGERKKLMIISVFLTDSNLYIMDEPFSGLDSKSIEAVALLINNKIKEGKSFIVVSHEHKEIFLNINRVICL